MIDCGGLKEANELNGDEEDKYIMDQFEEEEGYIEKFGLKGAAKFGRVPASAIPSITENATAPKKKKKKNKAIVTGKLI